VRGAITWGIAFGCGSQTKRSQLKSSSQLKIRKFPITYSPCELFLRIHKSFNYAYLLESMEGPKKLAEYSFIGFAPKLIVKAKKNKITLLSNESHEEHRIKADDPLDAIKKVLGREPPNEFFRFVGGAVGYVSYDAIRYWERLPDISVDDLKFPDVEMGMFDDGIIFDHVRRQAFYYYRSEDRFDELCKLAKEPCDPEALFFTSPKVNVKKEQF
jgi:anthranilate synthase component 1